MSHTQQPHMTIPIFFVQCLHWWVWSFLWLCWKWLWLFTISKATIPFISNVHLHIRH